MRPYGAKHNEKREKLTACNDAQLCVISHGQAKIMLSLRIGIVRNTRRASSGFFMPHLRLGETTTVRRVSAQ